MGVLYTCATLHSRRRWRCMYRPATVYQVLSDVLAYIFTKTKPIQIRIGTPYLLTSWNNSNVMLRYFVIH